MNPVTYPNPYAGRGGIYVGFDLINPSIYIRFRLYTTGFRHIKTADLPQCYAGHNAVQVDDPFFRGLANGVYYYIVTEEDQYGNMVRSKISELIVLK